jgi:hypothetical protein
MKKAVALLLLICCLSSWTLAFDLEIVETGQTLYRGGTVPGFQAGALGKLDLTRPDTLVFSSGTNTLSIPYANVQRFEYQEKLARHLGVIATIAVVLVKHRQRRHFIQIAYTDADRKEQVAIFEIAKDDVDATKATLETRTHKTKETLESRIRRSSSAGTATAAPSTATVGVK